MRYTLTNVPAKLDRALRDLARSQDKSVSEVVIATLQRALGLGRDVPVQRDLSDIVGTWQDDPEMDRAFAEQRRIAPGAWK